jgi:hypothetical protein
MRTTEQPDSFKADFAAGDGQQVQAHTPGPWCAEGRDANLIVVFVGEPDPNVDRNAVCAIMDGHAKEREANARLIAAAPDLLAALIELEQFHAREGEGPSERFERLGEIFYRETGFLRPGKDASPLSGVSYEERVAAWDKWSDGRIARARAALTRAT